MSRKQSAASTESKPSRHGLILLVEDDPMVRRVTQLTLEKAGFRLILAENGEEAHRLFEASGDRIELLVTDVVMPRVSGADLAKSLLKQNAELKVLFVSGYSAELDGLEDLGGERTRLLHKPYSSDTLIESIEAFGLGALLRDA